MKLALAAGSKTDATPEPYLKTNYAVGRGKFSPDGRWVAYESNESGRGEIYTQGYPDKRGKWLVSASGGRNPVWRPDGKELYSRGSDGTVTSASIELLDGGIRPGAPQPLFGPSQRLL